MLRLTDVSAAYEAWCLENREPAMHKDALKDELQRHLGPMVKKSNIHRNIWRGARLRATTNEVDELE